MIIGSLAITGCSYGYSVPKCGDAQVTETAIGLVRKPYEEYLVRSANEAARRDKVQARNLGSGVIFAIYYEQC
jgi:hypothetical protein